MNFAVAAGDWNLRGRDADQAFAQVVLSDTCIDAANRASRMFDPGYPGWELYSRIVRGDTMFDRKLEAWSIGLARAYTRAKKVNGQSVVAPRGRRNAWIARAGSDSLHFTIHGRYPDYAHITAADVSAHHTIYRRTRGALSACMLVGFDNYRNELYYQYYRVLREERELA